MTPRRGPASVLKGWARKSDVVGAALGVALYLIVATPLVIAWLLAGLPSLPNWLISALTVAGVGVAIFLVIGWADDSAPGRRGRRKPGWPRR